MSLSWFLSTQILMKITQWLFEVKYIIFLLGKAVVLAPYQPLPYLRASLPLVTPNLEINREMWYIPSAMVSPAWLRDLVVTI